MGHLHRSVAFWGQRRAAQGCRTIPTASQPAAARRKTTSTGCRQPGSSGWSPRIIAITNSASASSPGGAVARSRSPASRRPRFGLADGVVETRPANGVAASGRGDAGRDRGIRERQRAVGGEARVHDGVDAIQPDACDGVTAPISIRVMCSPASGSSNRTCSTMARIASSENRATSRAPQNASSGRMLENAGFG